jgi:hypothetical protein
MLMMIWHMGLLCQPPLLTRTIFPFNRDPFRKGLKSPLGRVLVGTHRMTNLLIIESILMRLILIKLYWEVEVTVAGHDYRILKFWLMIMCVIRKLKEHMLDKELWSIRVIEQDLRLLSGMHPQGLLGSHICKFVVLKSLVKKILPAHI